MRWTNYHGHCDYCDGKGRIEDYVTKALELNMAAIGISSHAPVPFTTDWTMPGDKLQSYLQEVDELKEKYKGQIRVLKALEVDFIPDVLSPAHVSITSSELDYTVGSVHFVDQLNDGTRWAIDGPADEFQLGLEEIFKDDIKQAVLRFYALTREMIRTAKPDIIGHMDKIKMHNKTFNLFDENEQWYKDEVRKTMELLARQNVIVEINTKAFYRTGLLFPGPEHFSLLKELNIPVTINSDAHHPDKLINGFEAVAQLLKDADIHQLHEFIDGRWQAVEFEKEGILL